MEKSLPKLLVTFSLFLIVSFAFPQLVDSQQENAVNNRPILGVLLLENADKTGQFIGASYVKYIESAGARVVSCVWNFKLIYD